MFKERISSYVAATDNKKQLLSNKTRHYIVPFTYL